MTLGSTYFSEREKNPKKRSLHAEIKENIGTDIYLFLFM